MKTLSLIHPVDPAQLEKETLRIYEICDGCRRCFNLCPSFTTLLDGIDKYEGHVANFTPTDHHRIVDECYYCKLCYNHCPYTPPHQFAIDFPRLMIAGKRHLATTRGVRWRDRLLPKTDLTGRVASTFAPLTNWILGLKAVRWLAQPLVGVHRDRQVLSFSSETFACWWERRGGPAVPASAAR